MIDAKTKTLSKTLTLIMGSALLASLSGCGGDGSSDNGGTTITPPSTTSLFTQSATWKITNLTKGATTCFDFDAQKESDCTGNTWDVKFENQERGVKLWSNSGASGAGKGGVFGLMDWSELKDYKNATLDPASNSDISFLYNEDKNGGIFNQSPWYAYSLNDDHKLYPNNRVYLITTDNTSAEAASSVQMPIYAIQITNYYNKKAEGGFPELRWIDTAMPNNVNTQQIDASSPTDWTYFNLQSGKVVDKSGVWHMAFKRDSIILNGGSSGTGKVGAYLAEASKAYYDDKGEPIKAKFMADNKTESLIALQNIQDFQKPGSATGWVTDKTGSSLSPAATGNYPKLDYGLFSYDGANHQMVANPGKGALIRSAEGNSFARMRLTKINYPDATSTAATSWDFEFDIQPASATAAK